MGDRTYTRVTRCRPIAPPPTTIDQVLKQCIDANAALTVMLAQATAGMTQMARRLADVEHRVAILQRVIEEL
ncbi:MAG TPA: hypothetical protein VEK33_19560 [Terriglobales bacterium]|nr:hypothetical protein [Terriglobales bacterium]